ncbi:MAG TPA: MBL fold metallo-hydrolase [bacterium]|nr:MBL fold metallo-hydrolase [bacterium]HPN45858.1 MBL fold metallo-hydrolase [bacterium]
MKSSSSSFVAAILLLLSVSIMMNCQAKKAEQKVLLDAAGNPITWFTGTEIAPKVWHIDDHKTDNMYLVLGDEKALLIDNGVGVADLAGYLKTITDLPVLVVTTHGHPDHAGANYQFKEVYSHPLDFELTGIFNTLEYHDGAVQDAVKNTPAVEPLLIKDRKEMPDAALLPVEEGYVFDLGNRKLKVIETPGHTPGSICLLDSANRILFTGDNNNTLVWLFLDGCLPLEGYLKTLEKQKAMATAFDTMYPGHGEPLDAAFIDDQIACVKQILSGECKGEPYQSFAGNALQCAYGRASVAFNPDNLREKK